MQEISQSSEQKPTSQHVHSQSLWAKSARRFRRHRLAVAGLIMLTFLVSLALLAPVLGRYDPNTVNLADRSQPPSMEHFFGTDGTGRDVFARTLHAGRISLTVGIISVAISATLGVIIGSIAGYFGGRTDMILMRITDMVLTFPRLVIIIAMVAILGPSLFNTMLVIGLLSWPRFARLTRGQFLSLREQEYVHAARSLGTSKRTIISEHLLPNTISPIMVAVTLDVATMILLEASLSFLGLGVQAPTASWGNMLRDSRSISVLETMPWMWIPPGLMIALSVLSINFIGDGLRDALDPKHIID